MFLRIWRLITIILAALTMGTAFAHALELPAKMNYDASLYTTINQSLYWGFGHVGGFIEAATVFLAAPVLTFLVRKRRPAFQWTLAGTVCLALAFIFFLVFTEPMNREIFQWSAGSVPADWTRIRNQWEYSHVTRFIQQLMGLSALLISVLVEIPTIGRSRDRSLLKLQNSPDDRFLNPKSLFNSGESQMIRLDNQVAIVTGSGRGLGAAYARLLAERGARVVRVVENA